MGKNSHKSMVNENPTLIWNEKVPNTEMSKFQKLIEDKYNLQFDSYWDLHKWSVENYIDFWREMWNYFGVIASKPYEQVLRKTGDGYLDNDWFSGARLNFSENVLRIRDDRLAIICVDELGNEEKITYSEVFEEVKMYAAAFRKHGLTAGDRVACYMPNRKECVYGMLAAASVGAIWGGPVPFYGARAATNIIKMMEAKFLFSVDHCQDDGKEYHNIENLQVIVDSVPSLEKVIIVPTKEETLSANIAHIRNSCLLGEFLNSGRAKDGSIPDIVFEQLPFNHPTFINFTSGTTGLPKAPVHSGGAFLTFFKDFSLHLNLREGDVAFTCIPVGWSIWETFVPCLGLGVTLFLYSGYPWYERSNGNFWDLLARHKVTYAFLVPSMVDRLEKSHIVPGPNSNLDSMKIIGLGGSPVKIQNIKYILDKVKEDVFVGSYYGFTEAYGVSGFDLNTPCHAEELQVPALAMDIRCFDEKGEPVVGQRGELVVATPFPTFPIYLWKDPGNKRVKEIYLSIFPGAWMEHDECWINPKTNGIVVIGRSDDTLKQYGERFGSGDIYFAIHNMEEIQDYICVGQEKDDGDCRAVLFVKMKKGCVFTPQVRKKIEQTIDVELWTDCVPQVILEVPDIPYNLNNKRMEGLIRKIVKTNEIPEVMNIKNPECLKHYCNIPELVNYNK